MDHAVSPTESGHYLLFCLDDQVYALALPVVERILRAVEVTAIPGLGGAILGVINVRGEVLPAFSLRRRLGLPERPLALTDQLIIARPAGQAVVLVVDHVEGVAEVAAADLVPLAALTAPTSHPLLIPGVSGVVRRGGALIVVVGDLPAFLAAAPLPDAATLAAVVAATTADPDPADSALAATEVGG